ncbi:MAG: hypothetical protein QXR76_06805 [Candidatus Bathyarchaeia archaeon]
MASTQNPLAHLILITALFTILIQSAKATSTSFTVHSGEEITKVLRLTIEDHVFIKFTVVGVSENTIHFYMTYPNETTKDFNNIGDFRYTFVCDAEGDYVLHFSNAGSSVEKLVTLDYEVEHYIFGVPQMLFLTIIVAIICIIAVATFIFLSKTH